MKVFLEIVIIVAIAVALGLAYNLVNPKSIPYIAQEKTGESVSDSELFGVEEPVIPEILNGDVEAKESIIEDSDPLDAAEEGIRPAAKEIIEEEKNSDIAKKDALKNKKDKNDIEAKTDSEGYKSITYEQMLKVIGNSQFVIVDARHPDAFSKNRIGDAINIYPYSENETKMFDDILNLPIDKTIVVYCDGGNCDSSHKIAEMILSFGYEKVFIFTGGWEEWSNKQK